MQMRATSPTEADIAADIELVAGRLGQKALGRSDYLQHGRFSQYQIYDGGRTFGSLCHLAGVAAKTVEPVSDDVYFERLAAAVKQLGRLPKVSERKRFGLNFSKRRYPTLPAFIDRAIALGRLAPPAVTPVSASSSAAPAAVRSSSSSQLTTAARPVPPIPVDTRRRKWERTGIDGFPYAPHDELGVVALFGILCSQGRIGWQILELRGGKGIDITCFDHTMSREIRVELKHILYRGSWNHKVDDIDYVVCWLNRWPQFPKPVIVLSELFKNAG
jgi:hypothetical protein